MEESIAILRLKYQRLGEIFARTRQRYIEVGCEPRHSTDNNFLTDEEKKETFELGTQVFGDQVERS